MHRSYTSRQRREPRTGLRHVCKGLSMDTYQFQTSVEKCSLPMIGKENFVDLQSGTLSWKQNLRNVESYASGSV